ncbi:MAG: penicillin acylase family protein [Bryobacterales bacterium]|nr:penicillin acylase family protein [Bryobacterales bacterium]
MGLLLLLLLHATPAAARYDVTVHRDTYGVPHIYGKTDADVVFGLAYAMAQDNFWQLEEDYIRQLGREPELYGKQRLDRAIAFRLFGVEKQARAGYAAASPQLRAICDAFAAGYNLFLAQHPNIKPRLLARLEGWQVLAFQDSSPSLAGNGVRGDDVQREFPMLRPSSEQTPPADAEEGSNMWAVSAQKSASGKPLLFLNPHVGFFGGGQRYEAHLESKQGLRVSGFAILGTPYIRSGFTARHGWCHTNNNADTVDVWLEPPNPEGLETWEEVIPTSEGPVKVRLRKTKHGFVTGMRDNRALAKRAPQITPLALMTQRIALAKARSLPEFRAAMQHRAITGSNTMYADSKGNIFYVHGNAIPKRNPKFDWTQPVDGADPQTEWQGLHPFADLPQFLNPASGFLQNCNSTPLLAAGDPASDPGYPAYFVPEQDNLRSQRSRQILTGQSKFTFDQWSKAALDTKILLARTEIDKLLASPQTGESIQELVKVLREWDTVSTTDSVPMTLFMAAYLERDRNTQTGFLTPDSLRRIKAELERDFGSWRVPFGEWNRLQRVHSSGRLEPFRDDRPSIGVPGAPGAVGVIFNFYTTSSPGQKRMYGRMGNTYVAVVEFGRKVKAASQLVFGQSADPQSPHYLDQAPLYAGQKFKPAWFHPSDVRSHTKSTLRLRHP